MRDTLNNSYLPFFHVFPSSFPCVCCDISEFVCSVFVSCFVLTVWFKRIYPHSMHYLCMLSYTHLLLWQDECDSRACVHFMHANMENLSILFCYTKHGWKSSFEADALMQSMLAAWHAPFLATIMNLLFAPWWWLLVEKMLELICSRAHNSNIYTMTIILMELCAAMIVIKIWLIVQAYF